VLVEEEMRRTIEYGEWMAGQWEIWATARTEGLNVALEEGLRAYAAEHVDREKRTCNQLMKQWAGLRGKARAYLAGITTDARTEVIVDTEGGDPDDPEGNVQGDKLVDDADAGDDDQEDDA
jgi:hypothetical protein